MRIRAVRPDELALLQDIERAAGQCFRDLGMPEIADDEPLPLAVLDRHRQAGLAWVAVDGTDLPVAYLIADRVDGNLHVEQVSVHPDSARRGVGRSLLDHLAEHAGSEGAPALTLTTFTEVPWNAPYYARCGFQPLDAGELTPGLRRIREREAAHGLDRWPRVCMRRAVGQDPDHDLNTWPLDEVRTFVQHTHGRQLEGPRVVAQGHAYASRHSPEVRRRWAKLSLLANRRMLGEGEGDDARVAGQDFALRMWVIEHLGPDDTDPDWSPAALTSDTLAALTLTPAQAAALADGWRDLPIERIRELRRHKNLTAHLRCLLGYVPPGPVHDALLTWTTTRRLLP
jgi:GNAT superfamily N-acetyltransferase